MDRERLSRALKRIDTAAARIERNAANPPSRASARDAELAEKYANLRSETGAALAELDQLIERLQA